METYEPTHFFTEEITINKFMANNLIDRLESTEKLLRTLDGNATGDMIKYILVEK
jgi:hypothetical protein